MRKILINGQCLIPEMILGSFQVKSYDLLKKMLVCSLKNGVYGFDTSPSYGNQSLFGKALHESMVENSIEREQIFITGKVDGWQMCRADGNVEKYVEEQMKELNIDYFDLLLVHWPFKKYLLSTWYNMEQMYKKGKVHSIGLCNINPRVYMEFIANEVSIKPQVIQNEISPLRVAEDEVSFFQKEGVLIEAYSPLARMLPAIKEDKKLESIALKYNKSIAQIILRWHIQRNIIPVFTSTKEERIVDNINVSNFELLPSEMNIICEMNQNYKVFPESYGCPGF